MEGLGDTLGAATECRKRKEDQRRDLRPLCSCHCTNQYGHDHPCTQRRKCGWRWPKCYPAKETYPKAAKQAHHPTDDSVPPTDRGSPPFSIVRKLYPDKCRDHVLPNVRQERRRKGRETTFETSARWRG